MKHQYRAIASRDLPKTNMGIKRCHSAAQHDKKSGHDLGNWHFQKI